MDYKYTTDIMHLFSDEARTKMPDKLVDFRDYLGHVIAAATVTEEIEFLSAIPCRKRIKRKPCEGFLHVTKQSLPESFIFWHCSKCDDSGRIANWRGCYYDQTKRKRHVSTDDEPNPPVEVKITREEMRVLLTDGICALDSERIVYSARPSRRGILLRGLCSDMDNFVGYIAADANHEDNKKRQRLLDSARHKVDSATQKAYESFETELGD